MTKYDLIHLVHVGGQFLDVADDTNETGMIDFTCYVRFTSSNIVFCASVHTRQVRRPGVMSSLREDKC